jgi:hypothetical protein
MVTRLLGEGRLKLRFLPFCAIRRIRPLESGSHVSKVCHYNYVTISITVLKEVAPNRFDHCFSIISMAILRKGMETIKLNGPISVRLPNLYVTCKV